jgi:hypothetical protein
MPTPELVHSTIGTTGNVVYFTPRSTARVHRPGPEAGPSLLERMERAAALLPFVQQQAEPAAPTIDACTSAFWRGFGTVLHTYMDRPNMDQRAAAEMTARIMLLVTDTLPVAAVTGDADANGDCTKSEPCQECTTPCKWFTQAERDIARDGWPAAPGGDVIAFRAPGTPAPAAAPRMPHKPPANSPPRRKTARKPAREG